MISSGFRQPALSSPESSDSPILPPPRIALRRPLTAIRMSLGRVPGFYALAPHFRRGELQRYEPALGAGHQVHAREAFPLLVPGEQPCGVIRVDPAPLDRRADLQQPEVADDAAVEASQPLSPDDADRIRADAALALEPVRGRVGRKRPQPLGIEGAADPDESRRLPRREAEAVELGGCEAREVMGERGLLEIADRVRARSQQPRLDRARFAAGDELARDRAQERVRDG